MWWVPQHGFGWWVVFGWMWMGLIWAVIIFGIVWAVRAIGKSGDKRRPEDALEIARRRYAAGELTREQFEEITDMLRKT